MNILLMLTPSPLILTQNPKRVVSSILNVMDMKKKPLFQ